MSSWHIDCDIIRAMAEDAQGNMDYYIDRLKTAGRDWSPETLAMRDLEHASRVLRLLAAEIQNAREAMIQHETFTSSDVQSRV